MDLNTFYEKMFLIRTFDSKLLELFSEGKIKGTVHTSLGQEACAVGLISALDKEQDIVFSNHRAHGHIIAYGISVKSLLAEIMGKVSGTSAGVGGTQHLHWKNFHSNGIQGAFAPVAVGSAMAEKLKGSGAISVVFLGDGTMGQGVVYESFNLASVWKIPVLFVLENNKIAQTTPCELVHAGNLKDRAEPFGIESCVVDGNDVEAVYEKASYAVDSIRKNSSPFFMVLDTYRLGPHSKGDDTRPEEEIKLNMKKEPILRLGKKIPDNIRENIEQKVVCMMDEAIGEILEEPSLSYEEFLGKVENE